MGGPPPRCYNLQNHGDQAQRDKVMLGLGMGSFNSTIRFDKDREVDVEMTTVSLTAAWLINDRWTVRAGMGVILDGELKPETGTIHDVKPGGLTAVGLEYLAHIGEGYTPFINLSLFLSSSWSATVDPITDGKTNYFASDFRLGARAGWTVNGNLFPFVAARVFGGPVQWELEGENVIGTDTHHYQLVLGTVVQLSPVGVYVEWAGFGEQALSAGLSMTW